MGYCHKHGAYGDLCCLVCLTPTTKDISAQVPAGGQKFDDKKLPMQLLSPYALEGTAAVLQFGAKKYAANNWRKGLPWTKLLGAIHRHYSAIMRGEDYDIGPTCEACKSSTKDNWVCKDHSGMLHIDCIGCETMFLQEFYRTRRDLDDRYKFETKETA